MNKGNVIVICGKKKKNEIKSLVPAQQVYVK